MDARAGHATVHAAPVTDRLRGEDAGDGAAGCDRPGRADTGGLGDDAALAGVRVDAGDVEVGRRPLPHAEQQPHRAGSGVRRRGPGRQRRVADLQVAGAASSMNQNRARARSWLGVNWAAGASLAMDPGALLEQVDRPVQPAELAPGQAHRHDRPGRGADQPVGALQVDPVGLELVQVGDVPRHQEQPAPAQHHGQVDAGGVAGAGVGRAGQAVGGARPDGAPRGAGVQGARVCHGGSVRADRRVPSGVGWGATLRIGRSPVAVRVRAVVRVGGDRALGDAHLVDLVGAVGEAGPAGVLVHVGERRVGRVAERAVHLDRPVDDAAERVGHEVLGHRHLGLEVEPVVDPVGGVQHHQLGLVELHRRVGDHPLDALLLGQQRAVRVPVERAVDHHVERRLGLGDPAHAVGEAGRAEPVLAEQVALAAAAEHVGVGHPQVLDDGSREWPVPPCMVSTSRTSVPARRDGMSTMNAVFAACGRSGLSSVRAMRMAKLARRALEMNHLWPLMTHSSPSWHGVGRISVGSEPATSGSVMAKQTHREALAQRPEVLLLLLVGAPSAAACACCPRRAPGS